MGKTWLMMVALVVVVAFASTAMADWVDTFDGAAGALDAAWGTTTLKKDGNGYADDGGTPGGSAYRATDIFATVGGEVMFTFKVKVSTGSDAAYIGVAGPDINNRLQADIQSDSGVLKLKFRCVVDGVTTWINTGVDITSDVSYDVKFTQASTAWWQSAYKLSSDDTWTVNAGSGYVEGATQAKMWLMGNDAKIDQASVVIPEPATLGVLAAGGILALLHRRRR